MIGYIVEDMMHAVCYLPWGMLIGIPLTVLVVRIVNRSRKKRAKPSLKSLPPALFCIYISIMLVITFFSRESGSRPGGVDLQLFSTWGINDRNRAFVIENVLLFIPYGFLYRLNFRQTATLARCVALGIFSSLLIELMQLVTARGFFQIDDILTNTIGALLGGLLCIPFAGRKRC